jgi:hypothetical protein
MDKRSQKRMNLVGDAPLGDLEHLSAGADVEVIDLSAGGACIRTTRSLEPGKRIAFSLNLKDADEEVFFEAVVQWVRQEDSLNLVGLKFVE